MALSKENIVANEVLKNLTDEQIGAIVTLSVNDENVVIGKRIGEIYREMDTTIESSTGIKRNGDEKTYNYLARASKEFASKFGDYDAIKGENVRLKEEVAKGGDQMLKSQVESLSKELASTKELYNNLKSSSDKKDEEHAKALLNYRIDTEIERAKDGIKYKGGLSDNAIKTLVNQAIANVKAKNPSFEERGGEQRLVFHDENGSPLNNSENQLNPFTARELLIKELDALDILDKKPNKGAGGKGDTPKEVVSASSQTEATNLITKKLLEKGLVKGTAQFQEAFNKEWTDGNISSLPIK